MPFTVKEFPGQRFETIDEYTEARKRRADVESSIEARSKEPEKEELTRVTATVLSAPPRVVETKLVELESEVTRLSGIINVLLGSSKAEKRDLEVGVILHGESQGKRFTVEVLENGYLCSDGKIYESLSGAALGVSGNRRSGWKFWKDITGTPIGVAIGRFPEHVDSDSVREAERM